MILFDQDKNGFDVYSLTPKKEEILRFKKSQIEKTTHDKRVFYATESLRDFDDIPFFEKNWYHLDSSVFSMKDDLAGVLIYPDLDRDFQEDLLEDYYQDFYKHCPVLSVRDLKRLRYFLLTHRSYDMKEDSSSFQSQYDGILELSRPLYLLQLFEQEKYDQLSREDLGQLFTLFDSELVDVLSNDYLVYMDEIGETQDGYQMALLKAQNDKLVISYIKQ